MFLASRRDSNRKPSAPRYQRHRSVAPGTSATAISANPGARLPVAIAQFRHAVSRTWRTFICRKPKREFGFLFDAARCQQIHVCGSVLAVLEVGCLDPSLSNQSLQAIVRLAETDSKLARHVTLAHFRISLQQVNQLVACFVGDHLHVYAKGRAGRTRSARGRAYSCQAD